MAPHPFLDEDQKKRIVSEFRVPVDSLSPKTNWVAALDRDSELPDDAELRQIRSFVEFTVTDLYREDVARAILAKNELVRISSHNTIIVRKGGLPLARGGWQYRRASWRGGPLYSPDFIQPGYRPHTLVEVLDITRRLGSIEPDERWRAWKREHQDIFPPNQ